MKKYFLSMMVLMFILSCNKEEDNRPANTPSGCKTNVTEEGKAYKLGDRLYLWAGADSSTHFDITGWSLDICQLYDYGYERETFKALDDPEYLAADQMDPATYDDEEQAIFVKGENFTKIYPYSLMKFHEVINENIDGEPVMVAYCFLADLAAVYTRIYCGKEFTFGVSGYTYADENVWGGLQAFVLWDRQTESLWWPLIDRAVSGDMQNVQLEKHTNENWGYISWGEVKAEQPDALVLQIQQNWQPPATWTEYNCSELECCDQ